MKNRLRPTILMLALLMCDGANAFETATHYDISMSAAQLAMTDQVMRKLGRLPETFNEQMPTSSELDFHEDFSYPRRACTHWDSYTAQRLIGCGAIFEDFTFTERPVFHFLDPQHVEVSGFGAPLFRFSAGDWALKDNPDRLPSTVSLEPQRYSYKDAEDSLWQALTNTAPDNGRSAQTIRERNWGFTFQSLGQVIHLVQDMASPQHTRDEPHFDKVDIGDFSQKSRYEQRATEKAVATWIRDCLISDDHTGNSCEYNPASPIPPVYPRYATHFQSPRSFWESSAQAGLAQVTSRSFPSNLRNFSEDSPGHYIPAVHFPNPAPNGVKDVSLAELTKGAPGDVPPFLNEACNGNLSSCKMRMIGAAISDPLSATPQYNDRASTASLFDQDLNDFNRTAESFDPVLGVVLQERTYSRLAINRFNIDRAYSLLIPRAVAYSTGLLNFYFRGEMSIKQPASGIFSIIDDSAFSDSSPADIANGHRGFKTVRLSLANTTPSPDGAPVQTMTNGKLWAILKFQRNNCYTDDLELLGTASTPLRDCLSDTEEIVVSDPIDRSGKGREAVPQPSTDNPDGEQFEFNFPTELPINAWNVLLQVVFRGTLGSEEYKIAVSTIDISEPTFITVFNNTDYVYMNGSCYTPQQVKAEPALWNRVSPGCLNPDHAEDVLNEFCYNAKFGLQLQSTDSDTPVLTVSNESTAEADRRIPPKRFSRVAILTDGNNGVDLSFHFWNPTLEIPEEAKHVHIAPYHAHKSRVTPGISTRDAFGTYRGVHAWYAIAFMRNVETMEIAEDDGTSCISGADYALPPLTDDARYPAPSLITLAAP